MSKFISVKYSPAHNSNLHLVDKYIFKICGLTLMNLKPEPESKEYDAQNFDLGDSKIKYRTAKITSKKVGQFVTLWHRNTMGVTAPFEVNEPVDFYIIATRKDQDLGLFIFPKSVLFEKGILSGNGKEGKRGFRVYPTWDIAKNKQAQQTQAWQKLYFLEVLTGQQVDIIRATRLLHI